MNWRRRESGKVVLFVLLLVSSSTSTGTAATYHLRADGTAPSKNEATDCSSAPTAMNLQTYAWQTLDPGDEIILCHEGGVFRSGFTVTSSGVAGQSIVFNGRGTAVVAASDIVTGWDAAGSDRYVASFSVEPQQVFVDGAFANRKLSLRDLSSNLDWFWGSGQLHLVSTSGNPDLVYDNPGVEASARLEAFTANGRDHIVIEGITARHANVSGFSSWNPGSNVTIRNCTAEWNFRLGIGLNGTARYDNITIEDNESRNNGNGGIGFLGPGRDSIIRRNRCYGNGKYHTVENDFSYFHRWTYGIKLWEQSTEQQGIEISENEVFDNGRGREGDDQGRGVGIWIDSVEGNPSNPIVIRHNLVYANKANGIFIEISSNTVTNYNVLHNNGTNTGGDYVFSPANVAIDSREDYRADNNLVYNNTVYGGRTGIKVVTYHQGTGCSVSYNAVRNNIVDGATEYSLYCRHGGDNDGVHGTGNVYTNNSFGAESAAFIGYGGVNFSTYAGWEVAYGTPTNAIKGDPKLLGTSPTGLILSSSSPCRDAGANLDPRFALAISPHSRWTNAVRTRDQRAHGKGWEAGAYVVIDPSRNHEVPPRASKLSALLKLWHPSWQPRCFLDLVQD